jgi:hypothetical protein
MFRPYCLPLACAIAGLALCGCADRKTTSRSSAPVVMTTTNSSGSSHHHHARNATSAHTARERALPENTGIPACDDYLSSYMACHRAAGVFPPGQLQERYSAMRTTLLRDSQNPTTRPHLADRCNMLASVLRDALHGKSCATEPEPEPAGTSR